MVLLPDFLSEFANLELALLGFFYMVLDLIRVELIFPCIFCVLILDQSFIVSGLFLSKSIALILMFNNGSSWYILFSVYVCVLAVGVRSLKI